MFPHVRTIGIEILAIEILATQSTRLQYVYLFWDLQSLINFCVMSQSKILITRKEVLQFLKKKQKTMWSPMK